MVYLTFSVHLFKCQILAAAGHLVSSSAHCRAVFSLVDKVSVHLMGHSCPIVSVKDTVGLPVTQTLQH
jgi:hypothetical protein